MQKRAIPTGNGPDTGVECAMATGGVRARWAMIERVLAFAWVMSAVSSVALGQGTIAGSVTDASGAPLPDVAVTVTSPELLEKARTAFTDHAGATSVALAAEENKRVLVLYATRQDSTLANADRVLSRFLDAGLSQHLDYYTEYLDLATFADQEFQAGIRDFFRVKYGDRRFDVVIAVDEAALEFVDQNRDQLFPGTPVVFFAPNADARRISNSTGVFAEPAFSLTLTLAMSLQPDIRQVFVVSGASARDRSYESLARRQFQSIEPSVTITYLSGLPAKELEERVSALPAHSVIYYLSLSQDGAGGGARPLESLRRLAAVANRPIYAWDDSTMGYGVVGGSLRHLESGIDALAQQALKVLHGQAADTIPATAPAINVPQVDWRQLQRWNIDGRRVPAGTVVLFREPSGWTGYQGYILSALALLLAQSALIAGLLVQKRKRRHAEELDRGSQAELRASSDRIGDLRRRILGAQDFERSRIVRWLHDDIRQELALLAADLRTLSGFGRARRREFHVRSGIALERAHALAKRVHDLAHRLHPVKIRLIGLIPALKALQRELSQSGLQIAFVHDSVPEALPEEFSLCLFRVVQEALHNAIRHSGATRISVHLSRRDNGLAVTIVDNGSGFDVVTAWGNGLGLFNMRERLEAIGGTLNIHSSAGAGTRLEMFSPLREARTVEIAT